MTTERSESLGSRVGARRFERYLTAIISGFGLLYALQTLDGFAADWPVMSGPLGGAAVGLVAGSVLVGTLAAVSPSRSRGMFLGAGVLFCAATAVLPFAITGRVPGAPMPWFVAMLPVVAAYFAAGFRRTAAAVWGSTVLSAAVTVVLVVRGGLPVPDAIADALFGVAVSIVLNVLIGTVRRGVRRADAAQRRALHRYGQSRRDDATEQERARTDALVHDSVLTTFLSAAAARDADAEELARRMAANALRVLAHVNRSAEAGPAVPLGKVLGESRERLGALGGRFDVQPGALADLVVPVDAGEALVASMLQAMESSVASAPDATVRTVRMSELGPDGVRILVADDGRGFDPADADDPRSGVLRDIGARMRAVDGRAVVDTGAAGTVVRLSWGSVVVSGVEVRSERGVEVPA